MSKATPDLMGFIRAKARSRAKVEPEVDWEVRKNNWLRQIAQLYSLMRKWLAPLEKEGSVRYLTANIPLQEDYIGAYEAEVLTVLIAKQRVAFYPKGTLIVGADGRIDIRGPKGVRTVVHSDDKWQLVERSPNLKLIPFNQDSFRDLLSEVML
ncbi:MAG: hypothetical protein NTX50_11715 [Candidatus Sumerlaeota bacterium]|nr:hypothetical protein [Candidatus Sumerlaeota bacterium]